MISVLTSSQVRAADQYTIENEPIESIDLMERASQAFVTKFLGLHPEKQTVRIFCGTGNNGGDGLAIGRLLKSQDWTVHIYVIGDVDRGSSDFKINLERTADYSEITAIEDFPKCGNHDVLIDGLFGSGLTREVVGLHADLIHYLNQQKGQRVAIDIASGLFSDSHSNVESEIFEADYTLSFQVPKLAFFQAECHPYVGEFRILDIGLNHSFLKDQKTNYYFSEPEDMKPLLPHRDKFTHKNRVGRLLIVAGSKGKMGASVLCTRAAFKSGVGLVNVCTPKCGTQVLQMSVPEAMVIEDEGEEFIQSIPMVDDTIAVGPGLGTDPRTASALDSLITKAEQPMVVDADAINILSSNKELLYLLPKGSILTPHPGEFMRLVGSWSDDFEKLELLRSFCQKYELNVVLKGAHSAVCNKEGYIYFNPSGNPSLATAGSGDVLTGIIGSLLSQGLDPFDALRLGVYLHGSAGDYAVRELAIEWIQASDIIDHISDAVRCNEC